MMCNAVLSKKTILPMIAVMVMTLGVTRPVYATFHFWTGAVGTDAADARNWDNGTPTPTLPGAGDNGMIGVSSAWELVVLANQPVLSSEWVNASGDPNAGWWILNRNSLTVAEGAYMEWTHNDCNLRNGAILRITGASVSGGPSLVIAPRFRVGQQGNDTAQFADATSALMIEGNGYLRFDPTVATKGSGGNQIYMGGEINALIDIRDDGILELVEGTHLGGADIVTPRFVFAFGDASVNKVVISGNGQLILPGDAPNGLVEGTETSLEDMIAMGLIASGEEGIDLIVEGTGPTIVKLSGQKASEPSPADGRPDADRVVTLNWSPAAQADSYDVYFGTDLDSVGSATRDNPMDMLQSMSQAESTYPVDHSLSLEHGQTYYWRVDGVSAQSPQTPLKGDVWSFTVEPYAIAVPGQSISVTASSQSLDQGPEKTIDGSGLDANDLHSAVTTDMWLSDVQDPNSAWIQFEFDKPFKLHEMLVWNYNGQQFLSGLGLKDVTIEVSSAGGDLQPLGVFELARATGEAGYAANTVIPLDGMSVQTVKISAHHNWANNPIFNKYGLGEVRFLHVPVAAREPNPESGAAEVAIDAALAWRAGREAAAHDLYLDTDEQAVADGTTPLVTVSQAEYSPALELGTTYFWRIDEVNQAEIPALWAGSVWNFTTTRYALIDGFESYDDEEGQGTRIYESWIDGYGSTDNGSQVGHMVSPFAEQVKVHQGGQSMPLYYDNTASDYSVADFAYNGNLAEAGATTLLLYFRGEAGNDANEPLWVQLTDQSNAVGQVVYGAAQGEDIMNTAGSAWTAWSIPLASFNVDVTQVKTLSIGLGEIDGSPSHRKGLIYIDDVQRGKP